MKMNKYVAFLLLFAVVFQVGCKKYLDEKPVKSLVVPSTLADLQALLDRHDAMNESSFELPETLADNYYLKSSDWSALEQIERENYVWDKDATHLGSWYAGYLNSVYYSNVVLDQLPHIKFSEQERNLYDNIKGSALFYRAFMFQRLADVYSAPYSQLDANTKPGIVLRTTASIETSSVRANVQQTYDRIINDLKESINLLPATVQYATRPSKTAAYAALARTYLTMRDYVNAGKYADLALQQNSQLLDYNTVVPGGITKFNMETIFYSHANFSSRTPYFFLGGKVDSVLYTSYDNNDLRKNVFFAPNGDGSFYFQGSYDSETFFSVVFDGLATDEMYLIRAECYARAGNKDAALNDLNTLMVKRWSNNGSWVPYTAITAEDALAKILTERRKELVYRGLRWSDIRRLNLEGANIIPKRLIDGVIYNLPPNDLRYVALIPLEVIRLTSIPQTPR